MSFLKMLKLFLEGPYIRKMIEPEFKIIYH